MEARESWSVVSAGVSLATLGKTVSARLRVGAARSWRETVGRTIVPSCAQGLGTASVGSVYAIPVTSPTKRSLGNTASVTMSTVRDITAKSAVAQIGVPATVANVVASPVTRARPASVRGPPRAV